MSTCTPDNCLGCCDANGRCAPGTTNSGCGKDGVACVACAMGQTCSSNVCTVFVTGGGTGSTGGGTSATGGGTSSTGGGTSGTGGGTSGTGGGTASTGGGTSSTGGGSSGTGGGTASTGGGTSGTGGGSSSCRSLTMHYDVDPARSEYRSVRQGTFMTWEALGGAPLAGSSLITVMEIYVAHPVGQPPSAPFSGTLPDGAGWRTCRGCIVLSTGCMQGGAGCTATYLAMAGNYSVTTATANTAAGSFIGEATNVRLEQWDLANDAKIGTDCYLLPRISWNGTWP